ncbi:MAG: hypothetical protein ACERKN_07160 [Velocimicrobium sp.]
MAANKLDEIDSITVSAKVLSKMLRVSERMVRYLAQDGIMVKTSSGRYKLEESISNYVANLRVNNDLKKDKTQLEDDLDLNTEKALHERVKRHITDLKYGLMKGNVHKSEDVEAVMIDMLTNFKTKMTALPSKLTPMILDKDKAQIQMILSEEIYEALREISGYNAADFYGKEYIDSDEEDDLEDEGDEDVEHE